MRNLPYLTKIFKALANPDRTRIMLLLSKEEALVVSEISRRLNISFKTVSHHLLKLENVGLLKRRYHWRWVKYSLNQQAKDPVIKHIIKIFKSREFE